MRNPRKDFAELIGADRVVDIVFMHSLDGNYYAIWEELFGARDGHKYAVHVFTYNTDGPSLIRSGYYRYTIVDALRLVVDLLNGVSV